MVIAITSNKGGTGKTTTALNLATGIARKGKKVLLVDLDSQANLTISFGIEEDNEAHIGRLLLNKMKWEDVIVRTAIVDLLPSSSKLKSDEKELFGEAMRENRLNRLLKKHATEYDYIIIDTPPALSVLTDNALFAADRYIIPVQADFFSYRGIDNLFKHILKITEDGAEVEFGGIVLTKYNEKQRGRLKTEVSKALKESVGDKVFRSYIRQTAALAEAPMAQQDIFDYAPESNGAEDYANLTEEVLTTLK
jgi:chromosome partitioning protein